MPSSQTPAECGGSGRHFWLWVFLRLLWPSSGGGTRSASEWEYSRLQHLHVCWTGSEEGRCWGRGVRQLSGEMQFVPLLGQKLGGSAA